MTKGLIARKLGMTQLFNADGTLSAVTVLEAGPCRVVGLRTVEKNGYTAVRLGFGVPRKGALNKPALGEFTKAGVDPATTILEVRDYDGVEVGAELEADLFAEGEL